MWLQASNYLINEADHVTTSGSLANQNSAFQMSNQYYSCHAMLIQILSFLCFKTSKITELYVHIFGVCCQNLELITQIVLTHGEQLM